MPYNSGRLLGPGRRLFNEDRLYHRQEGSRNTFEETPYMGPVDTEIRNYVPDPSEIGDFNFRMSSEDIEAYLEWMRRNPSVTL